MECIAGSRDNVFAYAVGTCFLCSNQNGNTNTIILKTRFYVCNECGCFITSDTVTHSLSVLTYLNGGVKWYAAIRPTP